MPADTPVSPYPLSLPDLAVAYRGRRLSPRELVACLQQRARQLNAHYRVYIEMLDDAQLEPFLQRLDDADPASLPLYGVPFAIKDNLDLASVATTAACPAYRRVAERSAPLVQTLIDLGAVPLGKTNLDQFATGLSGLRSPYGSCPNSRVEGYPSGGSSSGSALAVALGLASFALGTDTAGSGRVPAALNGLVGVKPTRGLLSTRGLVPCCPGLDCISLFARDADDAATLLGLCIGYDAEDPCSRHNPAWNAAVARGRPAPFSFGLPREQDLDWLGCSEGADLFAQAVAGLQALGGEPVELDFRPFFEAARLLYAPAGVAQRYASFGAWLERSPDAVLPVIREVVGPGAAVSAAERLQAETRLAVLKRTCDQALGRVDVVLTPTLPRAYTTDELLAEPILRNSQLGIYTNFMNLLDYAAVALPAGNQANGLPWGVTLFGPAFSDHYLLALARQYRLPPAAAPTPSKAGLRRGDRIRVVVGGAHLDGLALNHQLRTRRAWLAETTTTASAYRLYALAGGPPYRPALVRDASGRCIEVEVWELPSTELGSFLAGIGAPLGLGKVELADGRYENGFICEHGALANAREITEFGGWRAYLAATARG